MLDKNKLSELTIMFLLNKFTCWLKYKKSDVWALLLLTVLRDMQYLTHVGTEKMQVQYLPTAKKRHKSGWTKSLCFAMKEKQALFLL